MKEIDKTSDYDYINSVSQALVEKVPNSTKVLLYIIVLLVVFFLIWAYFAKIDQLVRGESKVIPYGQNQIVQNFEGGVITDILVEEGDLVKKGDVLLKLKNKQYSSTYEKNILEIESLKARSNRLYAEANNKEFLFDKNNDIYQKEYELYKSDLSQLDSKLRVFDEQISQKEKEKNEIRSRIRHLEQSFNLIIQEQKVMDPLVKRGIVSKVEYLKLLREANTIKDELESVKLSLTRISSSVKEYKNRYKEAKIEFQNNAHKEYNEVIAKIEQSLKQNQGLEDQVNRTLVISPVTGYIKKMHVNTIGGSVQPAMDLIEIVPKDDNLLIEAKIKPEDIAFLHPEQKVTLKFTAYDFTIYGSLDGKIDKISPDSVTDKENNTYYLVYIKTNKNYLGTDAKPLEIMPGMRGSADIKTGQKTIMTYLLKPLIKTKQYALTEN
ncbi:HlyD family type I secretion periplasmic adaptor subunit [Malaciobacter pacificus]|uniref:Type I secretion system membrane fusion protein, HlyD family n=1 Tax=Malaciobacter pacificus TaxID=1080223 RepID=A0A5C2H8Y2_9BACT|nr:HlyD family type I secretion periplasmic adaptor subunit [Malaciobacter pacificus]QEP34678.1 type I secretion system membrane fusion protein, HlyD family [Malaciobacter pacificus]GGD49047.1 HlyD family type I secretion periplasmic adaptor subunit [Malaciobacter pacificus]